MKFYFLFLILIKNTEKKINFYSRQYKAYADLIEMFYGRFSLFYVEKKIVQKL